MIELCIDNSSGELCEDYESLTEIQRIKCENLSYNEFFQNFMTKNNPVLIEMGKCTQKWECSQNWFVNDSVDFEYIIKKVGSSGHVKVPVSKCSKKKKNYDEEHKTLTMEFIDYAEYWQSRCADDSDILYLKDWHMQNEVKHYEFYRVPPYFGSDWSNEYLLDTEQDDYRFVYFGPKDSWTCLHSDVFGSFSWSTNIFGSKRWILLPPGQELKLADKMGNLPNDIDEAILVKNQVKYFTLTQNADETIFVPSNWYHFVKNCSDTVSINHNWFNSCNIMKIYKNLKKNLEQVEKEIEDCMNMQNFEEHTQLMLKALFGMNFKDFLTLLQHICNKRIDSLFKISTSFVFDRYFYSKSHIFRDLEAILEVLELCQSENKDLLSFLNLAPLLEKCIRNIKEITIRKKFHRESLEEYLHIRYLSFSMKIIRLRCLNMNDPFFVHLKNSLNYWHTPYRVQYVLNSSW